MPARIARISSARRRRNTCCHDHDEVDELDQEFRDACVRQSRPEAKDRPTMIKSSPLSCTALTSTRYRPRRSRTRCTTIASTKCVDHRKGAGLGRGEHANDKPAHDDQRHPERQDRTAASAGYLGKRKCGIGLPATRFGPARK